jgi:thymidine phosphorylase
MDKKVRALITDMNQPLGFAVGNALEIMEASQTLQNAGPEDLTKLSLELAAHMIHLGKKAPTLEEARRTAEKHLVDGSAYKKFKQVVQAQGGNPQALDKFELLPNATGMREITSPRGGYVSQIDAEEIGAASNMIGAGRDKKDDAIDPAVGIILEVKAGEKVDAGSVLCRLYYTREDRVEEAAEMVEDAFRISGQKPDERSLILEVVGV